MLAPCIINEALRWAELIGKRVSVLASARKEEPHSPGIIRSGSRTNRNVRGAEGAFYSRGKPVAPDNPAEAIQERFTVPASDVTGVAVMVPCWLSPMAVL